MLSYKNKSTTPTGEISHKSDPPLLPRLISSLLNGTYNAPRNGRNNDKAHPPIHPVSHVAQTRLETAEDRKVYEFVVRRFLACCSDDAKGQATTVDIDLSGERFTVTGLVVLERNYLDVYRYDKWTSSQPLPAFVQGEMVMPASLEMVEGITCAPKYLTEPELIALMDVNGIGTDATMADHIEKIVERQYVFKQPSTRRAGDDEDAREEDVPKKLNEAVEEDEAQPEGEVDGEEDVVEEQRVEEVVLWNLSRQR